MDERTLNKLLRKVNAHFVQTIKILLKKGCRPSDIAYAFATRSLQMSIKCYDRQQLETNLRSLLECINHWERQAPRAPSKVFKDASRHLKSYATPDSPTDEASMLVQAAHEEVDKAVATLPLPKPTPIHLATEPLLCLAVQLMIAAYGYDRARSFFSEVQGMADNRKHLAAMLRPLLV